MSVFVTGASATTFSLLSRFGLFFTNSNGIDRKLYKLKLTFLRLFLILGEKQT